MISLILSLLLFLGSAAPPPPPPELETAVRDYWSLMAKQDKFAALKHVLKGSENNFIALRAPSIRSWKISQIEMVSPTEARVTAETDALFPGTPSFQVLQAHQIWIHDGASWKVRIPNPKFRFDPARPSSADTKKPMKPELRVSPESVKIPFLNTDQRILITVANGTAEPARLDKVELDEERFELTDRPTVVEPGQSLQMTLHYTGKETAKDLKSSLTLLFQHEDKERVFQLPIVYNYLSPQTRQFFGLDEKAAQQLKRGDRLVPKLTSPAAVTPKATAPPAKPQPADPK